LQYVGQVLLASYGDNPRRGGKAAIFRVQPTIAKEIWAQVGLFDEWYMTVNGEPIDLSASTFAASWAELGELGTAEVTLVGYDKPAILLLAHEGFAALYFSPGDPNCGKVARTTLPIHSKPVYDFFMANGELTRVPANNVLPIQVALQVVELYHLSGTLSTTLAWDPYP
jgi:hypothetical protein